MKKTYFWNTLGSGLNSFNSLFFLIIVTRINGTKDAGIFTLCFATACLAFIAAVYTGRAYQVTDSDKGVKDCDYVYHRLSSSLLTIVLIILFGLISGYTKEKMLILILLTISKIIEAICDVFHGVLQKNERLDLVGISLFVRALSNVTVFLLTDYLSEDIFLACLSLVITDLLILIFVDINNCKKYKIEKKLNKNSIIKIYKLGFFTFFFTLISSYILNIPRYALDYILDEKYQTIFGIIVMPATLIYLLNQFILQPLIMTLKKHYEEDMTNFISLILKIIKIVVIIGLLCIVGAYFIGIDFLNIVYGINLNKYLIDLIIILFGAIPYAISNILSNALIITRHTKIQLYIYLFTAVVSALASYLFVKYLGFTGAAISYLFTMTLLLILYIISFYMLIIRKKEIFYERKN